MNALKPKVLMSEVTRWHDSSGEWMVEYVRDSHVAVHSIADDGGRTKRLFSVSSLPVLQSLIKALEECESKWLDAKTEENERG